MQLHHHAAGAIESRQRAQHKVEIHLVIGGADRIARDGGGKYPRRIGFVAVAGGHMTDAVVGHHAAAGHKVVQPRFHSREKAVKAVGRDAGNGAQLFHIVRERGSVQPGIQLVGAEGGQHFGVQIRFACQLFVILQIVAGIVGGADHPHIKFFDQAARAERAIRHDGAGFVPDGGGGVGIQRAANIKNLRQLHLRPVIQRAADHIGQRCAPRIIFFTEAAVTGDQPLVHAVLAHSAPFVVVARQPHLAEVVERLVVVDLLRVQMAVVIDDGFAGRTLLIQPVGGVAVQQQPVVIKTRHNRFAPFL